MKTIDFVTLMLMVASSGLFVLACYVYWGLTDHDQKRWSPAFLTPGIVLVITGLYMVFTIPIGQLYSSPYGEMSTLLGALLLGAGIALAREWNLVPVAVNGLFAGLAAIVFGVSFIIHRMSLMPMVSGVAFILAGIGGLCALPTLYMRKNATVRLIGALVLAASSGLLALTGYGGIWMHMGMWKG